MKTLLATMAFITCCLSLWAAELPRPEYPRPQFEREAWMNLNGTWSFDFDFGESGKDRNYQNSQDLGKQILVPYCPESKLSGVQHVDFINCMWYQRKISIPSDWNNKKIFLNFGAVDYMAEIYIDGNMIQRHYGGSSSFSVDVTRFVKAGQEHNLVIQVKDDLRSGLQTGGKQCTGYYSGGCSYTRVTGIWQTVWMEAVAENGLKSTVVRSDIDQKQLIITPEFYKESDYTLEVVLKDGNKTIAKKSVLCTNNSVIVLPVKNMKLWSPESPFLYDIVYQVKDHDGNVIDEVKSYAGMRKVHIADGKFYLNNEPYFQRLVLDQGYYPDGIWTAPSDEVLKNDIILGKNAGFNGARLHQKVFEERFHYWADRLGYLTWGEYPSWGMKIALPETRALYAREWREVVLRDCNHPSIIAWSPFNESVHPGEAQLRAAFSEPGSLERYRAFVTDTYEMTRELDPTRPVNDTSGYLHVKTDLWTVHPYRKDAADLAASIRPETGGVMIHVPQLEAAAYTGQPYLIDEFGGFRYIPPERRSTTGAGWGYHGIEIQSAEELAAKIAEQVKVMEEDPGIAGFCYTQLTDVEQEQNGVYNYDRTPKGPAELFRKAFRGNGR